MTKLLISAHQDTVKPGYNLSFKNGIHKGMIDNFAGILATYLVLYGDENITKLEAEGSIEIWHNKGEEWGRLDNAPEIKKGDVVLVVDCADLPHYKGYDFSIENISGFTDTEIFSLKESLLWQGFKVRIAKMNKKNADDEDESWQWQERGAKTMSFTIPITCPNGGWHRIQQDSSVSVQRMSICVQGLNRTINHLLS